MAYTCKGLVIQLLFLYSKMVQGRRNVDPKLLDMVRKLAARVEAIELVQNHERHLDDDDSFWDGLDERIDDVEESNLI